MYFNGLHPTKTTFLSIINSTLTRVMANNLGVFTHVCQIKEGVFMESGFSDLYFNCRVSRTKKEMCLVNRPHSFLK